MTELHISDVRAVEGNLYKVWGEDCEYTVYDTVVEAIVDGDIYHHNHVFKGFFEDDHEGFNHPNMNAKEAADRLVGAVGDHGIINLDHWELVGNLSELEDPMDRLEREWSDNSDHFECYENYNVGV